MEARRRIVKHYLDPDEADPFEQWMETLRYQTIHAKVLARLRRVEQGNLGDWKPCADTGGVCELRIDFGPGYRVYFGQDGNLVILLGGGMKSTQTKDIRTAKERWENYNA